MTTQASSMPVGGVDTPSDLTKVYVWEVPVRLTHWIIALSIVWLSVTGIYIGTPFIIASGQAGDRFIMGTVKVMHFYGATAFVLAVLSRFLWMFMGNAFSRWSAFLPVKPARIKGVIPTVKYYLFLHDLPPGFIGHNPLAGLAYLSVYVVCLVMVLTGAGVYAASADVGSPMRTFVFLGPMFGGLQTARWIHHIGMWLLLGFAVHHVYSAILMAIEERNGLMDSIFSGYKTVPRSDLVAHKGAWVDRRDVDV